MLNHNVINRLHYKVLIHANIVSKDKIQRFLNYCHANANVVHVIKSLGEWDFELDIEVKNMDKFRLIMEELNSKFPDIVEEYEALLVYKIHKYNLYPKKP